jgi:hypothetical protein
MREEPRSSRNLHLGSSVPPYIKPSGLTPPAGGAMAQLPLLQGEFLHPSPFSMQAFMLHESNDGNHLLNKREFETKGRSEKGRSGINRIY